MKSKLFLKNNKDYFIIIQPKHWISEQYYEVKSNKFQKNY